MDPNKNSQSKVTSNQSMVIGDMGLAKPAKTITLQLPQTNDRKPKTKKLIIAMIAILLAAGILFLASIFVLPKYFGFDPVLSDKAEIATFINSQPDSNATLETFKVNSGKLKYKIKFYSDARVINLGNGTPFAPARPTNGAAEPVSVTVITNSDPQGTKSSCSTNIGVGEVTSKYGTSEVCGGNLDSKVAVAIYRFSKDNQNYYALIMDSLDSPQIINAPDKIKAIFASIELL